LHSSSTGSLGRIELRTVGKGSAAHMHGHTCTELVQRADAPDIPYPTRSATCGPGGAISGLPAPPPRLDTTSHKPIAGRERTALPEPEDPRCNPSAGAVQCQRHSVRLASPDLRTRRPALASEADCSTGCTLTDTARGAAHRARQIQAARRANRRAGGRQRPGGRGTKSATLHPGTLRRGGPEATIACERAITQDNAPGQTIAG